MRVSFRIFLAAMLLMLLLGIVVLIYGLMHPSRLPQLTPRMLHAIR